MKALGIAILTLGVAVLVIAGIAYAQQGPGEGRQGMGPGGGPGGMGPGGPQGPGGPGGGEMLLRMFDDNQDGQISEREWAAVFDSIDSDGDGILSKEELAEAQEKLREENQKRMFERFDTDGDGVISEDEFPGRDERFDSIDTDGDGSITLEEFTAAHEKAMERMRQRESKRAGKE